jgi:hypothetical protein
MLKKCRNSVVKTKNLINVQRMFKIVGKNDSQTGIYFLKEHVAIINRNKQSAKKADCLQNLLYYSPLNACR